MERININTAVKNFSDLINRIHCQGISVELERENKIVARIVPVSPESALKVKDLNRFFACLPSLGEDAETFAKDVRGIRKAIPVEKSL